MKTIRYGALALALLVIGCAKHATVQTPANTVPDTPQYTVLKYTQLGAVSANTAAHTLVVLCHSNAGAPAALDPATCQSVAKYLTVSANVFSAIALEVSSNEPWPTMRVKLISIGASATTDAVVSDPTLKAQIDALRTLLIQILQVT